MKQRQIGIIGVGFVGGAMQRYLEARRFHPLVYDKYKQLDSVAEVNRAEIIFICVPTPYRPGTGFDLSAVNNAVSLLKPPKIVVIKSSMIPGATESLQNKFSRHQIMCNPEFLREVSAYEDLIHPDRQIIGVTKQSRKAAQKVMQLLPKAPFEKIMPSREAEMVKYMANSFLALKVVFANQYYDLCKKMGLNYEDIRLAVGADKRICHSHLAVDFDGYRGFGGSCFPKDVNAILQLAEKMKVDMSLLKIMRSVNRNLLKHSGLSEEYFLLDKHRQKKK